MNKTMIIETLFPEIANLFGDGMNIRYLKQCLPDAEFIDTALTAEPAFVSREVSMIYMGPMTESQQELVISALRPYKSRLIELIESGCIFLVTGNALEIFEAYIENEDGTRIDGLGIFATYAKRDMMHRYNSLVLGEYEGLKLLGFKAQFSHSYGNNADCFFYQVIRGCGLNPDNMAEGLKKKNFFATYCVGPFLLLNPLFVKRLLLLAGVENPTLAYEDTIMEAYNKRLAEFERAETKY